MSELDSIYRGLFSGDDRSPAGERAVLDVIFSEAQACLTAPDGINFANKVVLSIATRLTAERFMATKINDGAFVAGIKANQTGKLLGRYREVFPGDTESNAVLQRVALMTPENIHLNSFMYEPILDMSDAHLRKLYTAVQALQTTGVTS